MGRRHGHDPGVRQLSAHRHDHHRRCEPVGRREVVWQRAGPQHIQGITAINIAAAVAIVDPRTAVPDLNEAAVEKVESMIADAVAKGGQVVQGGRRHGNGSTFFEPTVITGATLAMQFATDEIFGPLSAVFKFSTEEEAIAAANATEYGLAAYAYTRDLGRAFRLNDGLEYGLIGINSGLITTVEAPFGGLKESGMGKEGGSQGLEDYLSTKYVCLAGLKA